MDPTVLVALCSLAGTIGGSLLGAITSTQLIKYRIDQLEEKVNKHNSLVERMTIVEVKQKNDEEDINKLFEKMRGLQSAPATH